MICTCCELRQTEGYIGVSPIAVCTVCVNACGTDISKMRHNEHI